LATINHLRAQYENHYIGNGSDVQDGPKGEAVRLLHLIKGNT